jgi:hypothetical protein
MTDPYSARLRAPGWGVEDGWHILLTHVGRRSRVRRSGPCGSHETCHDNYYAHRLY